jgi:subtilase family serine protease
VTRSGGQFTDKLVVKNTGLTTVSGFVTSVLDNGKSVGSKTSTLAAGASTTLSISWKVTPGQHTVEGVVDPANKIAESNESDNKLTTTVGK